MRLPFQSAQFKKGDVVLVSFPYATDQGKIQTRRRPAVIVSNDYNNARLDDVLVVPVTGNNAHNNSGQSGKDSKGKHHGNAVADGPQKAEPAAVPDSPVSSDGPSEALGPSLDAYRVEIAMNSPEGKKAGLRLDSIVDCTVIATVPKSMLVSKIGRFPPETIELIDSCLRRSIDSGPPKDSGSDAPPDSPKN